MFRVNLSMLPKIAMVSSLLVLTSSLLLAETGHNSNGKNVGFASGTSASVPGEVQYRGQAGGVSGVSGVTFALYAEQAGGVALWMERQNVSVSEAGSYSVLLGSETAGGIPQSIFTSNEARWLEVSYTDSLGAQVTQPRVLLVSVPYALKAADAETLGGLPASAFVLNPKALAARVDEAGGVAALSDVLPTAAISGTGTTNRVTRWSDGPNGVVADSDLTNVGGKVGLSNPNPIVELDVAGTIRAVLGPSAPFGTYLMPTGGPGNGFRFGFGNNLFFDGSNWRTRGDGANNAGSALLTDIGLGHMQIFTLPPTGGTDQVVDNASFAAFEKFRISANGNVGIGTTNPTQKLHVVGNILTSGTVTSAGEVTSAFTLTGNGAAAGKVLTSDANGVASWQTASGGISGTGTANKLPKFTGASALGDSQVFDNGTSVGVGTITPSATARLDVAGNVKITGTPGVNGVIFADGSSQVVAASSNVNIRGINYLAGCDTCSVLLTTDDQQDFYVNQIGSITVQSITCFSDAGAPTIDIRRDNVGGGTNASVLNGASMNCAQATNSGGGTTASGVGLTNNTLALNDRLDFVINTTDQTTTKRITVVIKALVN